MARTTKRYVCQQCAASFTKWMGRCENCGAWNSLVEDAAKPEGKTIVARSQGKRLDAVKLADVAVDTVNDRLSTGMSDIDTVLGGGLMPGGVILVAGEPGIGKSTLLLQLSASVAHSVPVLYATGEESAGQVKMRAERLGAATTSDLSLISTTSADDIAALAQRQNTSTARGLAWTTTYLQPDRDHSLPP